MSDAAPNEHEPGQPGPEKRDRRSRRRFLRRTLFRAGVAAAAVGTAGLGYARWIEPTWIEEVASDLPIRGLPPAWDGVRVAHCADLHHGDSVPLDYIEEALARVRAAEADLIAVTGDFVTQRDRPHAEAVAEAVATLQAPLGVFACLGNHDFGVVSPTHNARVTDVAAALADRGVRVLRNEAVRLEREGSPLWIAGVDDAWSGHFDAEAALADVPPDEANLVLCHNPDAAELLAAEGARAILSGHTHGGQVHLPLVGPPILPVVHRDRYRGLHRVDGVPVYINRGIGWIRKVRLFCRPEITVHTLRAEAEAEEDTRATG